MASQQKTAILVDDDAELVDAMKDVLEENGFAVESFTSAARALERLRGGPAPDVILVDYVMPGFSCRQFLSELADAGVGTPVMVVTGANPATIDPKVRAVAVLLPKPFSVEELLQHVELLQSRK